MADITARIHEGQGGKSYTWEEINHDDTGETTQVDAGRYTITCEGTWTGSAQIDIQYGQTSSNLVNVDDTNLSFTGNGSYNIEIGQGFIKPARSSGSSGASINVYLTPIGG